MKVWAVSLLSLLFVACANAPVTPRSDSLFNDQLFAAASVRVNASDVFALSPEMEHFLNVEIAPDLRNKGNRDGLIDAMYREGQLKIEYDSVMTRNAAQAFAARSGNCLSLVIMTAAFAKTLGLPVLFQSVSVDETVSRSEDIYFFIGHVNLTLGNHHAVVGLRTSSADVLTVDFLPPTETVGLHTKVISEQTVVAMYMNNKAAEAFAKGQINDAYWWVRGAIGQDPEFMSAYNTLGVIYRRHGNPAEAEKVLAFALEREPRNTRIMSNLVGTLNDQGKVADADRLRSKLEQIEPNPMFSYFDRGMRAMREGNFKAARDLFAKEVDRTPYYHEFHFWLANAYLALGDVDRARRELTLAFEYSTTRREHDLYAAKLDRIKSSKLR
jgi:Tfp pilus assembly protein PilF